MLGSLSNLAELSVTITFLDGSLFSTINTQLGSVSMPWIYYVNHQFNSFQLIWKILRGKFNFSGPFNSLKISRFRKKCLILRIPYTVEKNKEER